MPIFGATFVPGGKDDYFMPEVVAPAPQRVMPEVPQNMPNDLQRLESEARSTEQRQGTRSPANVHPDFSPFRRQGPTVTEMDGPSSSPFPKVKGDGIPPSTTEKEDILWDARGLVVHSNNVPLQLSWARDALMWADINAEAAAREWKFNGRGRVRPRTPKAEHELRVDAINIIEFLTEQNHPEALFMRGKWQEFGKFGLRENKKKAYQSYTKAADLGNGRAQYRMGMLYENANDMEKAMKHYRIGADDLKDSAAKYRLGMLYLMGQHGYAKDYARGLQYISDAAKTADEDAPQGAYVYGMIIGRQLPDVEPPDKLLPYDPQLAKQYIEKAAYLGFAKAQVKMGQAYELCQLGCEFTPAYSLHYYGLAAIQGQAEAALGVSRWFLFGSGDGTFEKNEVLAFRYAQEAADAGLATGEFAMGYYHEVGIHVPIDLREARRWYELAAEHGNQDAQSRIEGLEQSKSLTKQFHETTGLNRIKSQHGSQKGKRPDRLAKKNYAMPTLSEDKAPPLAGKKMPTPVGSPKQAAPVIREQVADTLDLTRGRPLHDLAVRSQSAAPYPEDNPPQPLNGRTSTAPYPDDDAPGPHLSRAIRPSAGPGPQADRPMSAFGIRPALPHPGPQTFQPAAEVHPDRRTPQYQPVGSGWEPQVRVGYRQNSPGSVRQEHGYRQPSPGSQPGSRRGSPGPPPGLRRGSPGPQPGLRRASPSQPPYEVSPSQRFGPPNGGLAPVGDPARARLQKQMHGAPSQSLPYPQQNGSTSSFNSQPGHGPRTTSRPASDTYGYPGGRVPSSGSEVSHMESTRIVSGGGPSAPRPRPGALQGRASAPPAQNQQYNRPPAMMTSSIASKIAHPDGKTVGQGPATFEEMGIPQGKHEGDCVVM